MRSNMIWLRSNMIRMVRRHLIDKMAIGTLTWNMHSVMPVRIARRDLATRPGQGGHPGPPRVASYFGYRLFASAGRPALHSPSLAGDSHPRVLRGR